MSGGRRRTTRSSRGALDLYVDDIRQYPLLTTTGERRLAFRYRGGDTQAWEELVNSNLRLVVKIAREFQYRGVSVDDLVSEGNLGLMEAAHRFDPERGVRFASYASWWIRKHIIAACQKHVLQNCSPLAGARRPGSRRPTPRSEGDRQRLRKLWLRVISIDEPRSSRGGMPVANVLASDEPTPDERVNDTQVVEVIHGVLDLLSQRERTILKARFGLDGRPPRSLQQVGDALGCTREWIRQLETRAINRVRAMLEHRYVRP